MMVIVTELVGDHHQALGVVGEVVFPGHADTAVQLDSLFGDLACGARANVFGCSDDAAAVVVVFTIGKGGGEDRHAGGLFQLGLHVDHTVLQHLELADRHTELLARLQVVEGQLAGFVHAAQRVSALRGDGAALLVTQRRERIADFAEQRVGADLNVVEEQLAALAPVDGRVHATANALSVRVDQEQADARLVTAIACRAR